MLKKLMQWFGTNPTDSFEAALTLHDKYIGSKKTFKKGGFSA